MHRFNVLRSIAGRFVRVIASISLVVEVAACARQDLSPTAPSLAPASASSVPAPLLDRTIETSPYLFRFSDGDSVDPVWQQAFHEWAVAALEVRVPERVTYNKYRSRQHMGDLTGRYNTNGYADLATFTIHTIWPRDNHEVIHVYSALFGMAVPLFNEGLAVAHQTNPVGGDFKPRWNGTQLHDWARSFRRRGTLVPLDRMLGFSDFRSLNPDLTYPEAGSFVQFVLDTYGLDRVRQLFKNGSLLDSADSVQQQFLAVYHRTIADVERDWWAMLDAR